MRQPRIAFSVCIALVATIPLLAQFNLNQRPSRILGHAKLELKTLVPNLIEGRELSSPQSVAVDTSVSPPVVYVSDTLNNRVLGWRNATSFSNGARADIVIGQTDFYTTNPGGPGTAFSSGLNIPTSLLVDRRGNLYVMDVNNNRILRYPKPFQQTDQVLPNLVIGQSGFSCTACRTANSGGISEKTLNFTSDGLLAFGGAMTFDADGNLWVADTSNHRILRYPASAFEEDVPNQPSANLVLGQADFVSRGSSQDARSKTAIRTPGGVAVDTHGRIFVSDLYSRVLVYEPPYVNGKDAARLMGIGQSATQCPVSGLNAGQSPQNAGDIGLQNPEGIFFIGGNQPGLLDLGNSRILLFDPVESWPAEATQFSPKAKGIGPVGQVDFCSTKPNRGQPEAGPNTLANPSYATVVNNDLWVVDAGNHRVLVVPLQFLGPTSAASRVLGQDGFYQRSPNLIEGREFQLVSGSAAEGGLTIDLNAATPYLYVADSYNNRILGFRDARKVRPGDKAELVIGQPDFQRSVVNWPNGDADRPSNQGLFRPNGVLLDSDGNLWVADTGNGRVLRFPKPFEQPSGATQTANLVIGQSGFNAKNTDPTARTLREPVGIAFAGDNGLLVSDRAHNRVLLFRGKASELQSGQTAIKVFGQPDFTSFATGNADNRMNAPHMVATDTDDRLYVADTGNGRVLIFNRAPVAEQNPRAAVILTGFNQARGLYVSARTGEIWVTDFNLRSLRYPKFDDLAASGNASNYTINFGVYSATAVTQDSLGNVYFTDSANRVSIHYAGVAALNTANSLVGRALAPGTIASAYRQGPQFTDAAVVNSQVPVPTTMADVQVTLNEKACPLYYVGPDQINFLVPMSAPTSGQAELQVIRASTGQILAASPVEMNDVSPGLFTQRQDGTGVVAALNEDNTVNSQANPIQRGKVIQLFGTGQGVIPNAPPDGTPPTGVVPTAEKPRVYMGGSTFIPDENVLYSGLAPGLVGVWQINARVPDSVPPPQAQIFVQLRSVASSGTQPNGVRQVTTFYVKQ